MSTRTRWWLELAYTTWGSIGVVWFFGSILFGAPRGWQIAGMVIAMSWYAVQHFRERTGR